MAVGRRSPGAAVPPCSAKPSRSSSTAADRKGATTSCPRARRRAAPATGALTMSSSETMMPIAARRSTRVRRERLVVLVTKRNGMPAGAERRDQPRRPRQGRITRVEGAFEVAEDAGGSHGGGSVPAEVPLDLPTADVGVEGLDLLLLRLDEALGDVLAQRGLHHVVLLEVLQRLVQVARAVRRCGTSAGRGRSCGRCSGAPARGTPVPARCRRVPTQAAPRAPGTDSPQDRASGSRSGCRRPGGRECAPAASGCASTRRR